jgi:hypothetical protein
MIWAMFKTGNTQQTRGWDAGQCCRAGGHGPADRTPTERIDLKVEAILPNTLSNFHFGRESELSLERRFRSVESCKD